MSSAQNKTRPETGVETRKPVWTWRDAIRQAKVPPSTKLVCYTIANYLSEAGKGWEIGIQTLVDDSGMGKTAVAEHIGRAVEAGLLFVERLRDHRGWVSGTRYEARFPDDCKLPDAPTGMQMVHIEGETEAEQQETTETLDPDSGSRADQHSKSGSRDESLHSESGTAYIRNPADTKEAFQPSFPKKEPPYPPPSGGSAGDMQRLTRKERAQAEVERMISDLKALPNAGSLVDSLFEPILRNRRFDAPSPGYAIKQLVDWAADWGLTAAEMAEIRDHVLGERKAVVKPADLEDAMKAVRQRRPKSGFLVSKVRTPRQYAAWLAFAEGQRADPAMRMAAKNLYLHGAWTMPGEWPPSSSLPGASGAEAAPAPSATETRRAA